MRNQWILTIGFAALAAMAPLAVAQQDPAITMMKERAKQKCENTELTECLGIDTATCKSNLETTMDTCVDRVSRIRSKAFSECHTNMFSSKLAISKAEMKACGKKHAEQKRKRQSQPKSPEQAYEDAEKQMGQMADAAKKAAQNVPKSRVTLPLYPDHEVMSHIPGSSMMMGNKETYGEDPVSTIKLKTSDSPSEVIAFYEEKLSGFKAGGDPETLYIFAADSVPDFMKQKPMATARELAQQEHVSISVLGDETHVEVGYRR